VVTEFWLVSPCALSWCVLRTEIICGAVWAEATAADPTNKQVKSAARSGGFPIENIWLMPFPYI
jgi:hypothetical protein